MTEQTDDELYAEVFSTRTPAPLSIEDQEVWDAVFVRTEKPLSAEDQALLNQIYPNN